MRTSHRWPALAPVTLALILALLTACGDGDGAAPSPSATEAAQGDRLDPCELVTAAEAADALGEPVTDGERGSTPPYESCTYNVESPAVKFVLVQAREDVSLEDFEAAIEDAAAFLGEEAAPVEGVGDSAYRLAGLLYAHKGRTEVVMSVVLGAEDGNGARVLEAEKKLAIIALGRAQ